MIQASAVVFAFLHIVFRNPLALALTLSGGLHVCRPLPAEPLAGCVEL